MYQCRIEQLTPRESEVFDLILEHKTTGQIADALCISRHTARNHIASVCRKHGIGGEDKNRLVVMLLSEDVRRLEKQSEADDVKFDTILTAIQGLVESTKSLETSVATLKHHQLNGVGS